MQEGKVQTLATKGATHEQRMHFSGHKTLASLLRYLNWGSIVGKRESELQERGRFDACVADKKIVDRARELVSSLPVDEPPAGWTHCGSFSICGSTKLGEHSGLLSAYLDKRNGRGPTHELSAIAVRHSKQGKQ